MALLIQEPWGGHGRVEAALLYLQFSMLYIILLRNLYIKTLTQICPEGNGKLAELDYNHIHRIVLVDLMIFNCFMFL